MGLEKAGEALLMGNYIVYWRRVGDAVEISRITYGAQDQRRALRRR